MIFKGFAWTTRQEAPFVVPRDHRLFMPDTLAECIGTPLPEAIQASIVYGIVMGYEAGGGLDCYMTGTGRALTSCQKAYVIDGMLDALLVLQQHEFVHGDVKPVNWVLRQPIVTFLMWC
jgi:serine/threonine protein kinase